MRGAGAVQAAPDGPGESKKEARCIRPLILSLILWTSIVIPTVTVPAAEAHHGRGCHTTRCEERVAAKACSQARPVPCIKRAAIRYRVSFSMLLRKARCESGLRWWARNPSGSSGLFQFLPSTWATTPYARRSIWSAKWSSLAAGWMHARGRGSEWVCT